MERIRIVPFKVNFDVVRKVEISANVLLWIAVLLALSLLVISKTFTKGKESYEDNVNYLLGVFSLFYFLTDLAKRFLLQLAEQRRRKDFIDNSLKTSLSDFKSAGYFSNEDSTPGVYKLGLNCFESSFFSMTISRKMIWPLIIRSAVILVITCSVVMSSNKITIAVCMQ